MDLLGPDAPKIAKEAKALSSRLEAMYKAIVHPFPYDDIRYIYKTVTSRKKVTRRAIDKGLIPDLDLYFSDTAGCSSWGKKALSWDAETRELFARLMSKEFFGKHPEYLPVRRWITQSNTPHLYQRLVLHEEMRLTVLALTRLLDKLESQNEHGN